MNINDLEGYVIIERCTVGDSVFVCGHNAKTDKPFVVWELANNAHLHPAYFDTGMEALSDFGHRIKTQADFLIRSREREQKPRPDRLHRQPER